MKQAIAAIFLILSITAFSQKVTVNGILKNNFSKDSITLSRFSTDGKPSYAAPIKEDGSFSIEFKVSETYYYKLSLDEKNYVLVILEPGDNLKLSADANSMFQTLEHSGSAQTDLFYQANSKFFEFENEKDSINRAVQQQMKLIEMKEQVYSKQFVLNNLSSLASLMLIDRIDKDQNADLYKKLDSALTKTYPQNKMVQDFHAMVQNMNFLSVGSEIPNIELDDVNGKKISLKDLRGKVVLVDFWATWCGPCKAEIPNLQRAYAMYKEKGFEIFSISLDRDKSKWEAALDSMSWLHAFDEGSKVARDFGVQSIPFTLLVDKDGKIVAKNLRGAELNMALGDLFVE